MKLQLFARRVLSIDRRVIFLIMGLTVALTLLFKFPLPIKPGHFSRSYFDEMEKLEAGQVVTLAGVYDPSTSPEIQPMVKATIRHAFRRKAKVVTLALWPQAPALLDRAMRDVLNEPEFAEMKLTYGKDYVHLGYMSGFMLVVRGMNRDIHETFPNDMYGTPLGELALMQRVHNFEDVAISVEFASGGLSGSPIASAWVMFAKPVNPDYRVLAASTAVMAAEAYPYLGAGQIVGFLGGLKGAADYEALLGLDLTTGQALEFMPAQAAAHVVIMLFIIIGNVAYFVSRRRSGKGGTSWR